MPSRRAPSNKNSIRILPLGGLGEIGKNMLVLETEDDMVVIDAGVLFPEVDMPGIEVVIPNFDYIVERKDKFRGLLITHGHEDHIGAVPHLLKRIQVPVYAPPMAVEIMRLKLREHKLLDQTDMTSVKPGSSLRLGKLEVEWFPVCHSIPDACGIAIKTPLGVVIHSGDFKFDQDPIIGYPTDYGRLAAICGKGVFLLLSDSTYAEEEGFSGSDRTVAESLFRLVQEAEGRVFIVSFASQIARVQIAADAARAAGRKLALMGRSMQNNVKIARELKHLDLPEGLVISAGEAASLPDRKVAYMTTGSQGEPSSALVRMSRNEHPELDIREGDTVILSSNIIPGNETAVFESIDDLVRLGAKVITNRHQHTHVSGHARREEMRILFNIARPQYFVPVHGEYRMLRAHADLAADSGVHPENVFLIENGDQLELSANSGKIVDKLPAGHIFVHGYGVWDESGNVVVERKALARDGIVTIALARDDKTGRVVGKPRIISTGFVHTEDAPRLFKDTLEDLETKLEDARRKAIKWEELEELVRNTVARFLSKRTRRKPLIYTVSIEI
ncbi:MAG: ribonuclease J [Dehalococcoidia bacterium]|nr:ribonuclease J [Dehalococcoidia bacterium]